MAEFVSKNELKPYKDLFEKAFRKVQIDAYEYGLTFTQNLVGSAKRNLVVRHHNKGFDCDYQIILQKNKKNLSAKRIKELLIYLFDKYIPNTFNYCEDSTSSITIPKANPKQSKVEFSYDIVILKDVDIIPQILRVDKHGDSKNYQWVKLSDMRGFFEKFNLIQGNEMWNDLKARYYKKKIDKINGVKYQDKKSFQLLHEAVNETLNKFRII